MLKKTLVLAITLGFLGTAFSCSVPTTSTLVDKITTGVKDSTTPTATSSSTPTTATSSTPATTTSSTTTKPTTATASDIKTAYDAFAKRFETEGSTPEGAIKMLFEALLKIEEDSNLAEALVAVTLNGKEMYEDSASVSGYDVGNTTRSMLTNIKGNYRIVRSFVGAVPDDDYQAFDKNNLVVNYPANSSIVGGLKVDNTITAESTKGRIYVKSSGKDLPTPIYMEKNSKGLWKVSSGTISSIATGVKKKPVTDF